ncbi:MAG: hypothetical protein RMI94_08100 [Bryobacterales bacterium]|nr:hypothetical protein [Bryobacteraceae bacterium]MDW8130497.1 hypothetical protein [Bryobacterales bacterium]
MRRKLWLVFAVAATLGAQTAAELFEKAPPEVDQALRERIRFFYQCHVEGKFRQADQVVAEDSKDAFFAAEKTRYRGFEIVRIVYSDNFTRARAVVAEDTDFMAPGFGKIPVKAPMTTLWKLENGQWWWYVDPNAGKVTPFGPMRKGEGGSSGFSFGGPAPSLPLPSTPQEALKVLGKVTVDKTDVRLSSYEPASAEVTVRNQMPGLVKLRLEYNALPGFEARLERQQLGSNETTRLLLTMEPRDRAPKPAVTVNLWVEPLEQVIPIQVTFAVPPELEKALPR